MSDHIHYLVELLGDLERYHKQDRLRLFDSMQAALEWLKGFIGYPDPEDDRILVWEVLPSGHKKVVWHFSGWHWDADEFGLPQGCYLGDTQSVNEISDIDA